MIWERDIRRICGFLNLRPTRSDDWSDGIDAVYTAVKDSVHAEAEVCYDMIADWRSFNIAWEDDEERLYDPTGWSPNEEDATRDAFILASAAEYFMVDEGEGEYEFVDDHVEEHMRHYPPDRSIRFWVC